MFDQTVNELSKYAMADHKGNVEHISLGELVVWPKKVFKKNQSIDDAARILSEESSTGFSVIGNKGELIGYLSEKDCLKNIFEEELNQSPGGTVGDYMTQEVVSFDYNTPIHTVLAFFVTKSYHTYPVTKDGILVGEVRRRDLLKAFVEKRNLL